jgi:hypothetical protein
MLNETITQRVKVLEEELKKYSELINKYRVEIDKLTTKAISTQGAIVELKKLGEPKKEAVKSE